MECGMLSHKMRSVRGPKGFTLIELLIVVTLLGILAAIVIPQFSSASDEANANALKTDLRQIRQQIEIYRQEHGAYPELLEFASQMTMATDKAGNTAAVGTAGFPYGPYLTKVPKNPFVGTSTIGNGAVGSSAWYYDETTGEFYANDSAETSGF